MTPPIRVAMLSSLHLPSDTRIFQKEARTLSGAGYQVTYIVPHDREEVVDGVRIRAFPRIQGRLRRMLTAPPLMLREALVVGADVYHFHDPELIPVGLVLKLMGKRVIYDAHEDLPKSLLSKPYLPRWARRPLAVVAGLVEKAASRAFDLVVVAGDGIRAAFGRHPRTLVLRNYPIQTHFVEGCATGGPAEDFVVAYSGGLTLLRGAREMVDAIARVPERLRARLEIFGKFTPPDLEAEVRGMPGFARAEYHGWVGQEELAAGLNRAGAGLVCFLPAPNHLEAGPNKLFEYMAAGLPVIASNFPAWQEIVEGNGCGVCVDPADPDAIAAAITYLAERPQLRAEMGERGHRAVRERYNWDVEGRRLIEAYRALGPRPAGDYAPVSPTSST